MAWAVIINWGRKKREGLPHDPEARRIYEEERKNDRKWDTRWCTLFCALCATICISTMMACGVLQSNSAWLFVLATAIVALLVVCCQFSSTSSTSSSSSSSSSAQSSFESHPLSPRRIATPSKPALSNDDLSSLPSYEACKTTGYESLSQFTIDSETTAPPSYEDAIADFSINSPQK